MLSFTIFNKRWKSLMSCPLLIIILWTYHKNFPFNLRVTMWNTFTRASRNWDCCSWSTSDLLSLRDKLLLSKSVQVWKFFTSFSIKPLGVTSSWSTVSWSPKLLSTLALLGTSSSITLRFCDFISLIVSSDYSTINTYPFEYFEYLIKKDFFSLQLIFPYLWYVSWINLAELYGRKLHKIAFSSVHNSYGWKILISKALS